MFGLLQSASWGLFHVPARIRLHRDILLLCGSSRSSWAGFRAAGSLARPAFLDWHPWFYLFLVPAVGMRLWAEERAGGHHRVAADLPITAWQAIVGNSWLLGSSWACPGGSTFPVVLTVNYLGHPDNGVILTAYLGSWLMAGAYLAISCVTSALTRSQWSGFIISLVVVGLFLILAGFPPVINVLLSSLPPLAGGHGHVLQRDDPFRGLQKGCSTRATSSSSFGSRVLTLYDQCNSCAPIARAKRKASMQKKSLRSFSIRPSAVLSDAWSILIALDFSSGTARTPV